MRLNGNLSERRQIEPRRDRVWRQHRIVRNVAWWLELLCKHIPAIA